MKRNNLTRQLEQEKAEQSEYKLDPRGIQRKEQKFNQKTDSSQEQDSTREREKNRKY